MVQAPRHKVFVSFHHVDQAYKDWFVQFMGEDMVDQSVEDGDINDDNLATETIRQYIRDRFIRDATVTVVFIGSCTWQRKHIDWEMGSSLRATRLNSRCGLLGILLPGHPNHGQTTYNPRLVPPRLADNCNGNDAYAKIYDWVQNAETIRSWIHTAFERRSRTPPDNSRQQFRYNRSGNCNDGWSS